VRESHTRDIFIDTVLSTFRDWALIPCFQGYPQGQNGEMACRRRIFAPEGLSGLQPCCYRPSCLAFMAEASLCGRLEQEQRLGC
jgi:hypothetical protein